MATVDRRLASLVVTTIAIAVIAITTMLFLADDAEPVAGSVVSGDPPARFEPPVDPLRVPPTVRDAPAIQPEANVPRPQPEELTLVPFESEVVDGDAQQPIGGATIVARDRAGVVAARSESKGNGRFQLSGLTRGKDYCLEVSASGFVAEQEECWIQAGGTRYTSVRMRRALALNGRIVDAAYLGIPSRLEIRRGTRRIRLETSPDGTFRVEDMAGRLGLGSPLPERIGGMRIRGDLHRDAFREILRSDLEEGRPLEIMVERGARVSGRVVARGGSPLPGIEILAYPVTGSKDADLRITHSREDGSFEIAGLGSGRMRIEPQHAAEGLVPVLPSVDVDLAEHDEHAGLEFAYAPGSSIRGQVRHQHDESPLPGMLVTLHHEAWLDATEVRTDEGGRFCFDPLPEGTYSVVLRGHSWSDPRTPKVVAATAGRDDILFVLDEPLRNSRVRVALRDLRSGEPLVAAAAAVVRHYEFANGDDSEPAPDLLEAPIDDTGVIVIDRLTPGRHHLDVKVIGYAAGGLDLEVQHDGESQSLELALLAGVELHGRVLDDRGLPVEGARIDSIRPESLAGTLDPELAVATDREGRFVLADVGPGEASLAAIAPGFAPVRRDFDFAHDSTDEIELRLVRGSSVSGSIRHRSGTPTRFLEIELVGAIAVQVTTTDAEGRFSFDAVEPGAFRIRDSERRTLESAVNDSFGVDLEITVRDR